MSERSENRLMEEEISREKLQEVFHAAANDLKRLKRIPISTYRLQFNHLFTFAEARSIIPYLHESHILRQSRRLDKTVNRSKRLKTVSHLCGNYSNIFS